MSRPCPPASALWRWLRIANQENFRFQLHGLVFHRSAPDLHRLDGKTVSARDFTDGPGQSAPDGLIVVDLDRQNPVFLAGGDDQDLAERGSIRWRAPRRAPRVSAIRLSHDDPQTARGWGRNGGGNEIVALQREGRFELFDRHRDDDVRLDSQIVPGFGVFAEADQRQLLRPESDDVIRQSRYKSSVAEQDASLPIGGLKSKDLGQGHGADGLGGIDHRIKAALIVGGTKAVRFLAAGQTTEGTGAAQRLQLQIQGLDLGEPLGF